jgi:GNAT superfamily N-acetyltransferase
MNQAKKGIKIKMVRDNLDNIPCYRLPSEYSIRWYKKGYEKFWLDIHLKAEKYEEITPDRFISEFGTDTKLLAQRQCFIFGRDKNVVGTATAWFNDNYNGQKYGRVHWVAIVPQMQGQGLAKPLMTCVCNRLRDLGHNRAYLNTLTARIPAINLYLKLGFVPQISSAEELDIWRKLQKKLKVPPDLSTFETEF